MSLKRNSNPAIRTIFSKFAGFQRNEDFETRNEPQSSDFQFFSGKKPVQPIRMDKLLARESNQREPEEDRNEDSQSARETIKNSYVNSQRKVQKDKTSQEVLPRDSNQLERQHLQKDASNRHSFSQRLLHGGEPSHAGKSFVDVIDKHIRQLSLNSHRPLSLSSPLPKEGKGTKKERGEVYHLQPPSQGATQRNESSFIQKQKFQKQKLVNKNLKNHSQNIISENISKTKPKSSKLTKKILEDQNEALPHFFQQDNVSNLEPDPQSSLVIQASELNHLKSELHLMKRKYKSAKSRIKLLESQLMLTQTPDKGVSSQDEYPQDDNISKYFKLNKNKSTINHSTMNRHASISNIWNEFKEQLNLHTPNNQSHKKPNFSKTSSIEQLKSIAKFKPLQTMKLHTRPILQRTPASSSHQQQTQHGFVKKSFKNRSFNPPLSDAFASHLEHICSGSVGKKNRPYLFVPPARSNQGSTSRPATAKDQVSQHNPNQLLPHGIIHNTRISSLTEDDNRTD